MNLHKLDTISFTSGVEGTATRKLPKISIASDKTKSLTLTYPSKAITLNLSCKCRFVTDSNLNQSPAC